MSGESLGMCLGEQSLGGQGVERALVPVVGGQCGEVIVQALGCVGGSERKHW